ncbi:hypothetical protein E6Q11_00465, partial [Candidatus Dojkabacteria bacterium]
MAIQSVSTDYEFDATRCDSAVCGDVLIEQSAHQITVVVDRPMTQAELLATPEFAPFLANLKPYSLMTIEINEMTITAVSPDLIARLELLFREIGLDVKAQQAAIDAITGNVGTLAGLSTTEKTSLVAALNEVNARVATAEQATASLIDDATTDTDTTWSSTKIAQSIADGIAGLVDGAPDALNTLNELAAALNDAPDALQGVLDILAKVVRVDQVQTFSAAEKAQG